MLLAHLRAARTAFVLAPMINEFSSGFFDLHSRQKEISLSSVPTVAANVLGGGPTEHRTKRCLNGLFCCTAAAPFNI
jgi:hypothetical protein